MDAALTFTRGDTYKALPGYQIMGSHYHVGMVPRLKESGSLNNRLNDVESLKALGINIFGVIDGVRGREHGRRLSRGAGRVLRSGAAAVGQDLPCHAEQGEHRDRSSAAITT